METIIFNYLVDPSLLPSPYLEIFWIIRALFLIVSLSFIVMIIYGILTTDWLKYRVIEDVSEFISFKSYGSGKYAKEWKKLNKKLDSGIEAEYKLALMGADTMLDTALEKMGYNGKTIDEKLKKVTSIEIPNIEELKSAREIRNSIIYDPDYHISKEKAGEIMSIYEKTLKNFSFL